MISENSLVIYKAKPAIVRDFSDGKYSISLADGTQVKVRDKDIELIHQGPAKDFTCLSGAVSDTAIHEAWELLLDEGSPVALKELASLICGDYTPFSAYAAYSSLRDGLYFSGTITAIVPRSQEEVAAEEEKRSGKMKESTERTEFLQRIKACLKKPTDSPLLPEDARFMQDVQALAYGKSAKSRTMKDLGLGETPEDAHALLLKTGVWPITINPHPARFGVSLNSAVICPDAPPAEERKDLCRLAAFAIDSPWSNDPDDAISIETSETGESVLYVHIADPSSSVTFDSPVEREARDRGTTLYIPEGAVRMLAEEALPIFALGLSEKSPALTFKMTLNENGELKDTEIFPSIVKVKRITYEDVDKEIDNGTSSDADTLRAIYKLTQKICKRRTDQGAIIIDMPETHIVVKNTDVEIEPIAPYRSNALVRECMITAGEGAGTWAITKGLAFPYISQEVDIQGKVPGGLAGSWHLRRSMRPRVLSTKPGRHQGQGLDTYSQVTSPLRRYNDLLAHIQIRAFLRGEKTLSVDELSARLGFCEAAVTAAVHAERASNNHWIMVYLYGKKDSMWDAVALENKGSRWLVVIPCLALETQVPLQRDVSPNDDIKLILKSVNISKGEAVFVQEKF